MILTKFFDSDGKETTPDKADFAQEFEIDDRGKLVSSRRYFAYGPARQTD